MKAVVSVVAVALLGCGGTIPGTIACTSTCGVHLREPIRTPRMGSGLTCDNINDAEDNALMELAQASDPRMKLGCLAIRNWNIQVWDLERKPVDVTGYRYIAGSTECTSKVISLTNIDWRAGAYTHELAHAIQNCDTGTQDPHSGWDTNGIQAAVERVRGDAAWEFED